jgi:hypothetical protein
LEQVLLPYVSVGLPKSKSQHGFVAFHSTTSALLPIVTKVANGFNQKQPSTRTATIALDISKAFDGVDHTLLLKQISGSTFHSNIIRWLAAYLRGRRASCHYQSARSPMMIICSEVPQGSELSPALSNFFVSDFPYHALLAPAYADDFSISESAPDLDTIADTLTKDLEHISK